MADRLTQLQDCLDDLLEQMHRSLAYIQARHPYGEIPGQPSQAPDPATISAPDSAGGTLINGNARQEPPSTPPPETSDRFNIALHELARDLIIKEQQIEFIIKSLPGIDKTEANQEARMRELEVELREVERERAKAEAEKDRMVDLLGQMIVGVKRVP